MESERSLPHAVEVERSILGAVLLDSHAFTSAAQILAADDFFSDANRFVYEAMSSLFERSEAIDPVTLRQELESRDVLERAGGRSYLASLIDGQPAAANVEQYARIVKDKAAVRRLIEASNRIIGQAMSGTVDTDELLDHAEHAIFQISESKIRRGFLSVRDLAFETMKHIEDLMERGDAVTGVPTGYPRLDQMTAGFQPGDLIILAARPSMGKCLAHDAEIVLGDGSVVTIEDVVRRQAGPVPTLGDDLKLGRAQPSAFVDDGVKPTFEVQTRLGRKVTTTLTHPFLTSDGWRPLAQLKVGDKIAVPRRLETFGSRQLRECEVKLLAYLIGDGGLTGTCPRFTNSNPRIAADFSRAVEDFGGLKMRRSSTRDGETPSWRVSADLHEVRDSRARFAAGLTAAIQEHGVTGRAVAAHVGVSPATVTNWRQGSTSPQPDQALALCDLLDVEPDELCPVGVDRLRTNQRNPLTLWLEALGLMGRGSADKHVPDVVFTLRRDLVALFLNRLFATDGWATVLASGQAQLGYATVNERLARQVQHLLLRFGVIASLRQRWVRYGDARRVSWQLDITDSRAIGAFAEAIGIFGKEERLDAAAKTASAKRYQSNRDLIPMEVWSRLAEARGERSWREVAFKAGIRGDGLHVGKRAPTRDRLARLAASLEDEGLQDLAESDVYWDAIVSIEAVGPQQVYDLTIPDTHNFVANDVCVHNTALALNMAQHVALEAGGVVGFFSLEMSVQQVIRRLMTAVARVDAHKLSTGYLSNKEKEKLLDALHRLSETKIFIDDSAALTVLEMRAKARRLKAEHGLDLLVVDYLQLVRGGGRSENRNLEIGEISRSMKALAKELRVPVIALSQLSRAPESRSGNRPLLSDLRECVTGDTLVQLSDGSRVPIERLVDTTPEVLAMSPEGRLVAARSDKVWPVGKREVLTVRLASGRTLRGTGRHRLFASEGWRRIEDLQLGDEVRAFGPKAADAERPSARLANVDTQAESDLFWDRIVAIDPAGEEIVYDLTVPGPASWVGNSVISHNSGNLEQDADVVAFIFRPEVYTRDDPELEGVAELIISKQRNGPIGTVKLAFLKEYTLFKERAETDEAWG